MNQHRDDVSPGDRVFFWETGPDACLRVVGRVTSPVYERGADNPYDRYGVDVAYELKIDPPLTREEILQDPILQQFRPFSWAMGTNIPIRDANIVEALEKAIRSRATQLQAPSGFLAERVDYQKTLDDAIKNAERETLRALSRQVAAMDPTAFEWLVRALLLSLTRTLS